MEQSDIPYVVAIDVGAPRNIGWADSDGVSGGREGLQSCLEKAAKNLSANKKVAIGFECPVWIPVRSELERITRNRGGVEAELRRAWSASPGACAGMVGVSLMSWCFQELRKNALSVRATTSVDVWEKERGLFVWEAFVSGEVHGEEHVDDARLAVEAFMKRISHMKSDIQPGERCVSLAVAALLATGWMVNVDEVSMPAMVVCAR